MSMPQLSVVILTKNEEQNIVECLNSTSWADQQFIVDSGSQDRTVELARAMGATILQHPFVNFSDQRNWALEATEGDWIFFVDADERATPELAAEIRRVIVSGARRGDQEVAGWWVPRRNYIWGQWIRHAGWSPDYQLRLLRHGRAHYDPQREVHEVVLLDGAEGFLENTLTHYNYQTISQFLRKQDSYTTLEARILFKQGVRPKWRNYVLQPWREFWRRYVALRGYRDGVHGLVLSVLLAYYNLAMYTRLRRMWARP
jgi:(heptosyl)LPS beta-1,4-glucosyltransferase